MRDVPNFEGHQEKLMWTDRRGKKFGNGELKFELDFVLNKHLITLHENVDQSWLLQFVYCILFRVHSLQKHYVYTYFSSEVLETGCQKR